MTIHGCTLFSDTMPRGGQTANHKGHFRLHSRCLVLRKGQLDSTELIYVELWVGSSQQRWAQSWWRVKKVSRGQIWLAFTSVLDQTLEMFKHQNQWINISTLAQLTWISSTWPYSAPHGLMSSYTSAIFGLSFSAWMQHYLFTLNHGFVV